MDIEVVPKLTVRFQRTFTFLIEFRVCYSKILIDDPEKEDSPLFFAYMMDFIQKTQNT